MNKFLSAAFTAVVIAFGSVANAATFQGIFWDANQNFSTIDDAIDFAETTAATATFESSLIDYPISSTRTQKSKNTLAEFLGSVDSATLSGAGASELSQSVFRWTGFLDLTGGDTLLSVASDDGFRLLLGGETMEQTTPRGFRTTSETFQMAAGITPVTLWFFENGGKTGVEFRVNGSLATPTAPVPLPATLMLSVAGIGALVATRRMRQA